MTFLKRIISPLAAIAVAVALSISAGALAQQGSDTVNVSVTLTDDQVCSVELTSAGSFGTWTWNGAASAYEVTSASSTVEFTATFPTMPPSGKCNVNVGFTGLTDTGGTNHIPPSNFHATSFNPETDQTPLSWSRSNVTGPTFTFRYKLTSVPDLPAGSYTGLIKVDVANAA